MGIIISVVVLGRGYARAYSPTTLQLGWFPQLETKEAELGRTSGLTNFRAWLMFSL